MKYAPALLVLSLAMCCVPAATATPSATLPVPVKALIAGAGFNGPAGTQPSHQVWDAKRYGKWSGWSQIATDGAGNLVLTAYQDATGWHTPWLSSKFGYRGRRYIEARANVPCGPGTWSAPIWEWKYPYGRIPGFENNVAEQLGHEPADYHTTLHYWTSSGGHRQSGKEINATSPLCGTFHTYGAAVFSNRVDFYLDGALTNSIPASAIGLSNLIKWKMVMNIDLAMGGLGGAITVASPAVLVVDFIHIYRM